MRFDILRAVKMPCALFSPENVGSTQLRKASMYLKVHTALLSRVSTSGRMFFSFFFFLHDTNTLLHSSWFSVKTYEFSQYGGVQPHYLPLSNDYLIN
jgi:hypothetical protein